MADLTISFWQIAFARPFPRQLAFRSGDSFFNRVARINPLLNRRYSDAVYSAGRRTVGVVDAIYSYWAHIALILCHLFDAGRPSAIARLIISIAVHPINGVIERRSLAHVGEEADKRFVPSFAHGNTAPAILREIFVSGLLAPRLHADPDAISRATLASNFVAVLQSSVWVSHSHLNSRCPLKSKALLA